MQNGIASHLHFLTDVQGNMYTYVSHLRYHANDGIPWETQRKIMLFKLIIQLMYGQEPFLGTEKRKNIYINPYSIHKIKRKKSYIFNKSIVTQNAEPGIKSVIFLPLKVRKKQKNLTVIVNAN